MASKGPVICEGPDGSGKTTLAKKLADEFGLEYRRPPESALTSAFGPGSGLLDWWQVQLRRSDWADGVYDRCTWISDPIYRQAQPGKELTMSSAELLAGILDLWSHEPIIVFCLPSFEVQLSNVHRSGRDRLAGVTDEALEKISNQYWAYYGMWLNSLFEQVKYYDYMDEGEYDILLDRLRRLGVGQD